MHAPAPNPGGPADVEFRIADDGHGCGPGGDPGGVSRSATPICVSPFGRAAERRQHVTMSWILGSRCPIGDTMH